MSRASGISKYAAFRLQLNAVKLDMIEIAASYKLLPFAQFFLVFDTRNG